MPIGPCTNHLVRGIGGWGPSVSMPDKPTDSQTLKLFVIGQIPSEMHFQSPSNLTQKLPHKILCSFHDTSGMSVSPRIHNKSFESSSPWRDFAHEQSIALCRVQAKNRELRTLLFLLLPLYYYFTYRRSHPRRRRRPQNIPSSYVLAISDSLQPISTKLYFTPSPLSQNCYEGTLCCDGDDTDESVEHFDNVLTHSCLKLPF